MSEIQQMMDTLVRRRAVGVAISEISAIFDSLLWRLDETSIAEIHAVRDEWLKSENRVWVEAALFMDETLPLKSATEATKVLAIISKKWPEFGTRCATLSADWDQLSRRK